MIYIDFTGRCGNQLFQYSFAKKISSLNSNQQMAFNFFHVFRKGHDFNGDKTFCNEISNFNISNYVVIDPIENSLYFFGSNKQKRLYRRYKFIRKISYKLNTFWLLKKIKTKLQKYGIYYEDELPTFPVKCKSKDIFIKGYFEDPKLFDDIKDELILELVPKFPKKDSNMHLYDLIDSTNSICVSVRVWNEIRDDKKLFQQRNVCTIDYYNKSINEINRIVNDPIFIVFSNDVEWVKHNLCLPKNAIFETEGNEVWEKLRLMYSCKHYIMATSTFSWWAQFLSRNNDKIVICPSKWFMDDQVSHLIDDKWIKVEIKE